MLLDKLNLRSLILKGLWLKLHRPLHVRACLPDTNKTVCI